MILRTLSVLFFLALVMGAWYYPQLPDTVASYFDTSGHPDGWSSKDGFMLFYGALMLIMYGVFLGTGLLMRILPDSQINVPNKEYWFADER